MCGESVRYHSYARHWGKYKNSFFRFLSRICHTMMTYLLWEDFLEWIEFSLGGWLLTGIQKSNNSPARICFCRQERKNVHGPDQLLALTNPARLHSWNKDERCAQIWFLFIFSVLFGSTGRQQCERRGNWKVTPFNFKVTAFRKVRWWESDLDAYVWKSVPLWMLWDIKNVCMRLMDTTP